VQSCVGDQGYDATEQV